MFLYCAIFIMKNGKLEGTIVLSSLHYDANLFYLFHFLFDFCPLIVGYFLFYINIDWFKVSYQYFIQVHVCVCNLMFYFENS